MNLKIDQLTFCIDIFLTKNYVMQIQQNVIGMSTKIIDLQLGINISFSVIKKFKLYC